MTTVHCDHVIELFACVDCEDEKSHRKRQLTLITAQWVTGACHVTRVASPASQTSYITTLHYITVFKLAYVNKY